MKSIDYAEAKLSAVNAQIEVLKRDDFPQPSSREALSRIEDVFTGLQSRLNSVKESSDESTIYAVSSEITKNIAVNLPFLGFIRRSTNVRNAFEFYGPILLLARKLLQDDTKLIIASEWDFAPFTYPQRNEHLKDFVLIGLPASESANVLIVPLCAHELGHHVWRNSSGVQSSLKSLIVTDTLDKIENRWEEFRQHFGEVTLDQLQTDILVQPMWRPTLAWALTAR